MADMKLGFFGVNAGVVAAPASMARVAQVAEAAGFESLWTGEHVVAASPRVPPSPVRPDTHFVDQIASLAFLAAHTSTIRLGTGIVILPQRTPAVLAKELASVDVLSGGRLEAGFGVGYVPAEFEAVGVPFRERGARMTEHIDALRAMWRGDLVFRGRFTSWSGVEAHPRPTRPDGPPIHVGGGSPAAFRRAVMQGNGWYGFATTFESTAAALSAMTNLANELERPAGLGRLEISVTPTEPLDREVLGRYRDLGVDRIIAVRDFRDISGIPDQAGADRVVEFLELLPGKLGLR
ncbi:MAG: TIGR03619 family F420-dependent LLM class oxidoreductase [Acidimicrobiales bacterium]|nr:TIGR03619 family F420-dependent LLM class oxidoreductase [Acidimicrobiales bacterium]